MKNKVACITIDEAMKIKSSNNGFLAELDGAYIKNGDDYLNEITHALKFPEVPISYSYHFDMITDLSWINEEDEINLIIYNFSKFLKDELFLKRNLLNEYKEDILPFWEEEVAYVVAEGKPRSFNVYLVD